MRTRRVLLGDECGVARVPSLMMLLTFSGLLLAGVSASALERNVTDTARARHLAEAGIQVGFNVLINTPDFSTALAGASASAPWVPVVATAALSGATTGGSSAPGTYTVIVRNDYQNADSALTGQSSGTSTTPNETLTTDGNGIVIMRATGSFNGVSRTIEVVVRRQPLPLPATARTGTVLGRLRRRETEPRNRLMPVYELRGLTPGVYRPPVAYRSSGSGDFDSSAAD